MHIYFVSWRCGGYRGESVVGMSHKVLGIDEYTVLRETVIERNKENVNASDGSEFNLTCVSYLGEK